GLHGEGKLAGIVYPFVQQHRVASFQEIAEAADAGDVLRGDGVRNVAHAADKVVSRSGRVFLLSLAHGSTLVRKNEIRTGACGSWMRTSGEAGSCEPEPFSRIGGRRKKKETGSARQDERAGGRQEVNDRGRRNDTPQAEARIISTGTSCEPQVIIRPLCRLD